MIFTLPHSPPYTNRRFSLQRQESYSSFSTPNIRFCPIIIPHLARLSIFFRGKGVFYSILIQKTDFVFHKVRPFPPETGKLFILFFLSCLQLPEPQRL